MKIKSAKNQTHWIERMDDRIIHFSLVSIHEIWLDRRENGFCFLFNKWINWNELEHSRNACAILIILISQTIYCIVSIESNGNCSMYCENHHSLLAIFVCLVFFRVYKTRAHTEHVVSCAAIQWRCVQR